jgi:hypothetical protein
LGIRWRLLTIGSLEGGKEVRTERGMVGGFTGLTASKVLWVRRYCGGRWKGTELLRFNFALSVSAKESEARRRWREVRRSSAKEAEVRRRREVRRSSAKEGGSAKQGEVRRRRERFGEAGRGSAKQGEVRRRREGSVKFGEAGRGSAKFGEGGRGSAKFGEARRSSAKEGEVRRRKERLGEGGRGSAKLCEGDSLSTC